MPKSVVKTAPPRHGVSRVISKLGLCSRTQAARWVEEGRVRVNGELTLDVEFPVRQGIDRVTVDGFKAAAVRMAVMLNKPRGLVTSTRDEQGRETVYRCFEGSKLPWLAPVGRLDKASEGLLLFSNDPLWAAGITNPATGPCKTYHVQIDRVPDARLLQRLIAGVSADGEMLRAHAARAVRAGARHGWIEIVLNEGRNRQIRRLLAACDVAVLRLVRIAIGSLQLGALTTGKWRELTPQEINALSAARPTAGN